MQVKSDLKSFFYSCGIFVLLVIAGDQVVGLYLEHLLRHQKKGDFHEMAYALRDVDEEVLIFGSSRAVRHYDPNIIDDSLELSTFNIGKVGNTLLYSDAVFSQVLTYHKPKMVVLDVSPIEFAKSERERGEKSMMNALLKYDHLPAIQDRLEDLSPKDVLLSKLFRTYKFNSALYTLLINDSGKSKLEESKGFEARKGAKVNDHLVLEDNSDYQEDPEMVKTFHNFLANAKKHNVELHVVISPTTLKQTHTSVAKLKSITQEYGFDFIDLSFHPDFRNAALYYDKTHLNAAGAKKFSEMLGGKLDRVKTLLAQTL